jgi:hypothetical protein
METLKARKAWSELFWILNENNFNPRILFPAKLSFKINEAIKIFQDKLKLKQYMTTKPSLLKILQGILHTEDESKQNHKRMGSINHRRRKDKESDCSIDSAAHNQTLNQQKQLNSRNQHIHININHKGMLIVFIFLQEQLLCLLFFLYCVSVIYVSSDVYYFLSSAKLGLVCPCL